MSPLKPPSVTAATERNSKKVLVVKKGYESYDEENRKWLERLRRNMDERYERVEERTKQLTAQSFLIVDCEKLTPIAGRNIDKSIEIASISKVMTCYLSLMICKKYSIDMQSHLVRVSDKAADTPGTTAELQSGDLLTIQELLYGLMLPSGNDASVALAEGLGKVIQRYKQKETKKSYYETFIAHMNMLAR